MRINLLLCLLFCSLFITAHAEETGTESLTTCTARDAIERIAPDAQNNGYPVYSVKEVLAVEHRLVTLRYNPGVIDGIADAQFKCAVMAFQKMNGLERSGLLTLEVLKAMENPLYPVHTKARRGIHAEADLKRQVMTVYKDDEILRILPISSGSDIPFKEPEGGYGTARTPLGKFRFFARIWGLHVSHLGDLFNPVYFHEEGYAVHGDTQVPAYGASHGCLRITIDDSKWFVRTVPLGSHLFISKKALPVTRTK